MSVNELGPVGDQDQADRAASSRRPGLPTWLPEAVVRYRVMTLVPLLALAGVALAGLAGLPALGDLSSNGSGCCPPH